METWLSSNCLGDELQILTAPSSSCPGATHSVWINQRTFFWNLRMTFDGKNTAIGVTELLSQ